VLIDDFIISETPGAAHSRNAPSPAATFSLALAQEVMGRVSGPSTIHDFSGEPARVDSTKEK
jgi:hypothetical protein